MDQAELLAHVLRTLERLKIVYMVVGSVASGAYGEPRMTQDIDIVISVSAEEAVRLCAAFPADEFYVSREAALAALAQAGQFNVIHPTSGNKIDFIIARNDAWGREQMRRRQRVQILPQQEGSAARAEDLILSKMLYYKEGGSEKHLRDIAGILKISPDEVNRDYVAGWAAQLDVLQIWQAVLKRLAAK